MGCCASDTVGAVTPGTTLHARCTGMLLPLHWLLTKLLTCGPLLLAMLQNGGGRGSSQGRGRGGAGGGSLSQAMLGGLKPPKLRKQQ